MRIIFVTGAPGAGKTFIADYISDLMRRKEKIMQIGADVVRDILRTNLSEADFPALHASSLHEASCAHYIAQTQPVVKLGIVPAVLRGLEENKSMVFEGVNCIPSVLKNELANINIGNAEIYYIVVAIADEKIHLKQLKQQNDVDVTAKMGKIKKIRHMQDFLIADGKKANACILEGKDILEQIENLIAE